MTQPQSIPAKLSIQEAEALLKEKITSGAAEAGLFKSGDMFVVADVIHEEKGDRITFTWFDELVPIEEITGK